MDPLLISNEGLSGSWYKDQEHGLDYFQRFQYSIKNIKKYFNQPKIIIVFREPSSFIYSSYKQSLHERGTLRWNQFFPFETMHREALEQFAFSRFVDELLHNFEEGDLLLLDYDELRESPETFVDHIKRFCLSDEAYEINRDVKFPIHEKSNVGISSEHEWLLILNNRMSNYTRKKFGFSLKYKVGRFEFSANTFAKVLLPKSRTSKKPENLAAIKAYYHQDWEETSRHIQALRPQ